MYELHMLDYLKFYTFVVTMVVVLVSLSVQVVEIGSKES